MIIPIKHLGINWVEGMKVQKDHFIETENFIVDNLRDVASVAINNYNFGLLPPLPGSGALLSNYDVSKTATNQLQIRINNCQAITAGGVRISIGTEGITSNMLSEAINLSDDKAEGLPDNLKEHYYVMLVVNPFDRVVWGNPDPEEVPVRQPYTQPKYELQLVLEHAIKVDHLGAYHLVIGRITRNGNDFAKDEAFTPPCSSVSSSDKLMQHYQAIGRAIDELQNISLQILQKILYKDQKSAVAQNIKAICQTILNYCNQHYFYFRNMAHQQPPVHLVNAVSVLSSHLYTSLQIMAEKEKEELLNYFFEWSDITPVYFLNKLSEIVEINYNHYEVGNNMQMILELLNKIVFIWQKLNTLEYIGQHKENIVVKEELLVQAAKERKGWSILD